jgi:hypothetical protein
MDVRLLLIIFFTILIHWAETLSYSVRLGGIKLGKMAVAMSVSGIILLVSRTSNMVQGPLVAGIVDTANRADSVLLPFRIILLAASAGTLLAIFLYPTFTKLSMFIIRRLEIDGSIPNMIKLSNIQKLRYTKTYVTIPRLDMIHRLRIGGIPKRVMLINIVITGIYTSCVLATLYASLLVPEFRTTASQLTGLINGIATILLTVLLDPHISLLSERSLRNENGAEVMSKTFGWLMISRFLGTLLAQAFLLPAASIIAWTSKMLGSLF